MAGPLAQMVRAKYPGVYDDLSDADLEAAVRAKYPGAYDDLAESADAPDPSGMNLGQQASDFAARVRAGGRQEPSASTQAAMAAGFATGGMSIPAQIAATAGAGYLGSRIGDGKDRQSAALDGAIQGGAQAVGGGIIKIGSKVIDMAVPLVRSYVKAPIAELRRRAGIEGGSPNAVANRMAKFIVDEKLTTADKARALVTQMGQQVDDAVARAEQANPELRLDTAERIPRYLNVLLQRIERQMLPGKDRAAVQNTARELVEDSPLSRSTYVPPPSESLESGLARGARDAMAIERNAAQAAVREQLPYAARWAGPDYAPRLVPPLRRVQNDRPRTQILRDVPRPSEMDDVLRRAAGEQPGRAPVVLRAPGPAPARSSRPRELRDDVRPSEGVSMARTKSFFDKDASGGQVAAGKTIERAVRDSVKAAVPETVPLLGRQGRALDAVSLLDRGELLAANRDTLGGFHQGLGFANSNGLIGLLMQAAKEGQLRLGVYAPEIGSAIQRGGRITPDLLRGLLAASHSQE